jgi:hypothetical protein
MIVSRDSTTYISRRTNWLQEHSCFNHHIERAQKLIDQTILYRMKFRSKRLCLFSGVDCLPCQLTRSSAPVSLSVFWIVPNMKDGSVNYVRHIVVCARPWDIVLFRSTQERKQSNLTKTPDIVCAFCSALFRRVIWSWNRNSIPGSESSSWSGHLKAR